MVLDLGCGNGHGAAEHNGRAYIGLDIDAAVLAASPWRERVPLVCGSAEQLPFRDGAFSAIRSGVAIPYMDIPKVAAELHRVAAPGATVYLSGHGLKFTLHELVQTREFVPLLYRLYVLANGLYFHVTGRMFRFPFKRNRIESFQTPRSLIRVMRRAGFAEVEIVPRSPLPVSAKKPPSPI